MQRGRASPSAARRCRAGRRRRRSARAALPRPRRPRSFPGIRPCDVYRIDPDHCADSIRITAGSRRRIWCARMDFLVDKDDLHRCRIEEAERARAAGGPGAARRRALRADVEQHHLRDVRRGDVLLEASSRPRRDGAGCPCGASPTVLESRVAGLEAGTRVFGYLPPSSELLVDSRAGERARASSTPPPTARSCRPPTTATPRVDADPVYDAEHEDAQMLLRPLFFTSWLIDDFLARGGHVRRGHGRDLERLEQDRQRARLPALAARGRAT